MKLYLLRHGNSDIGAMDHQRELSEKGREDIRSLGNFLKTTAIQFTHVWHSERLRTKETGDILLKTLGFTNAMEARWSLEPNASITPILSDIYSTEGDTLIIGHLPFLEHLVSKLLCNTEDKNMVDFKTGSMVCLESIKQNQWQLLWMLNPSLLAGI